MSRSLGDILYSGMGDQFEQFLEPEQLHALSLVSKTTRDTNVNARFRVISNFMLQISAEYQLDDYNTITLDSHPLRYLVKLISRLYPNPIPYTTDELYDVAEYLWNIGRISTYTITLIRSEIGKLDLVKNATVDLHTICSNFKRKPIQELLDEFERTGEILPYPIDFYRGFWSVNAVPLVKSEYKDHEIRLLEAGYDPSLIDYAIRIQFVYKHIITNLAENFSARFAIDSYRYAIQRFNEEHMRVDNFLEFWYPISKDIREMFVNSFSTYAEKMMALTTWEIGIGPKDIYGYGLCYPMALEETVRNAVKFEDYDLFVEYAKQYFNVIDETYLKEVFYPDYDDDDYDTIDVGEIYDKLGGYKHY